MLRAILIKSWRQHPTKHQLYGLLPPITKTIQVRRTRHAEHCWRSKDKLISDVLLWTPTYGRAKAGRTARTYIQLLWEDTGCNPEDLPEAMNDREKWRERVRDIRAGGTTWWWWWYIYISKMDKIDKTNRNLYFALLIFIFNSLFSISLGLWPSFGEKVLWKKVFFFFFAKLTKESLRQLICYKRSDENRTNDVASLVDYTDCISAGR